MNLRIRALLSGAALLAAALATAAPSSPQLHQLAQQEQPALLDTLRALVEVESGSKDLDGLAQLAGLIAGKLKALGGEVSVIEPTDLYRMDDTPARVGSMVKAQFKGRGSKKVLFIAHMDTVYLKGMLKGQPFRIDGNKAYGLAIADDKQGVATILHAVALLQKAGIDDYGTLTVLINGDEEISSPGARATISSTAADQDLTLSFEAGGVQGGVRLATSGIGAAYLSVEGRASHAGARPEAGINALTELAHQLLQMQDLSAPDAGVKLNWTLAQAGTNRNVIPAQATAQADVRALRVADFERLEQEMQRRIQQRRLPDAKVQLKFEVRRPPLEAAAASRALARRAQQIYAEIGLPMKVAEVATGGGTDAAFAALHARGPVIEGLGLTGFGAHSNDAEYVDTGTIAPRLYLIARLVMELSAATAD
ncbi:glutamate carboxypeptidase [Roseateles saccharophilus]|uniref:Glutamate carboxypeptidase n=1 Tax=Roseateles saccharophilus TaxID=304 RepID=A0A4R3VEF9_ROSSA|nr:glutamate carboxypeptidase [Roseateles saccharophilus]MDG0832956.1 M20/M25/M40 family metallo-hydrolase [Roseateles saccharophilus]TCV02048.1 glutamate carboxypeptidase [Roseateles saccharophilus]